MTQHRVTFVLQHNTHSKNNDLSFLCTVEIIMERREPHRTPALSLEAIRHNQGNLITALTHPMRTRITFNTDLTLFVLDGELQLSGLLRPLDAVVSKCTRRVGAKEPMVNRCPPYVWEWASVPEGRAGSHVLNGMASPELIAAAPTDSSAGRPCLASGLPLTGRQHGTIVHRQLESFVKVYQSYATKKRKAVSIVDSPPSSQNVSQPPLTELFLQAVPSPDPCVLALVNFCAARRWIPMASEYCVFDEELGIGTAADLLVYERYTRRLVLLEIKTGHPEPPVRSLRRDATQAVFVPPAPFRLPPLPACDFVQHQLQLLCTYSMLSRWNVRVHKASVIYVTHTPRDAELSAGGPAVSEYPMNPDFVRLYLAPMRTMLLHWRYVKQRGELPLSVDQSKGCGGTLLILPPQSRKPDDRIRASKRARHGIVAQPTAVARWIV